jgi:hypothetical protein
VPPKVKLFLTVPQLRAVAGICLKSALLSSGMELTLEPEERQRLMEKAEEILREEPTIGPACLEYVALEMIGKLDGRG